MITQQSIDRLKAIVSVVEVVSAFVPLRKSGVNYVGLCPFHPERTPSFHVHDQKGLFKCFGCNESGDAIDFIQKHLQLSYPDALRWLAHKYSFILEEIHAPAYAEQKRQIQDLQAVMECAQAFFVEQRKQSPQAQQYLAERGIDTNAVESFALGFGPPSTDALVQTLIRRQFNLDLAVECGLVGKRDNRYSDNYRNRLIFPIRDALGKMVAFSARAIDSRARGPKYINSPENELFVKSKVLYHLHAAKREIAQKQTCIVVEGYTDVIRLYQAGWQNVVASAGTALTAEQLRLLEKYTRRVVFIYDADEAGQKATIRAFRLALARGLDPSAVLLPAAEDPDSFLRTHSPEQFAQLLREHALDVIDFRWARQTNPLVGVHEKNQFATDCIEDIAAIERVEDRAKRFFYAQKLAARLHLPTEDVVAMVDRAQHKHHARADQRTHAPAEPKPKRTYSVNRKRPRDPQPVDRLGISEKSLLRVLLLFGDMRLAKEQNQKFADVLVTQLEKGLDIRDEVVRKIFQQYVDKYHQNPDQTPSVYDFVTNDTRAFLQPIVEQAEQLTKVRQSAAEAAAHERSRQLNDLMRENERDIYSTISFMRLRYLWAMIEKLAAQQRDEVGEQAEHFFEQTEPIRAEIREICTRIHGLLEKTNLLPNS